MADILYSGATSHSRSVNAANQPELPDSSIMLVKAILHRCGAVEKIRYVEPCSEIVDDSNNSRFNFIAKELD